MKVLHVKNKMLQGQVVFKMSGGEMRPFLDLEGIPVYLASLVFIQNWKGSGAHLVPPPGPDFTNGESEGQGVSKLPAVQREK